MTKPALIAIVASVGCSTGGAVSHPLVGPTTIVTPLRGTIENECAITWGAVSCQGELAGDKKPSPVLKLLPTLVAIERLAIDQTGSTACAVNLAGEVACWGSNMWGACAQGWAPDRDQHDFKRAHIATPSRVKRLQPIAAITAGYSFFCALARDGSVWCWGGNDYGQVTSVSDYPAISSPVRIEGVPAAAELAASLLQACLRDRSGAVWCWGDAPEGTSHEPRLVTTGATSLHLGGERRDEICATTGDATVTCWDAGPTLTEVFRDQEGQK